MSLAMWSVAIVSISVIYCIYHRAMLVIAAHRKKLRDRVAFMLWQAAQAAPG